MVEFAAFAERKTRDASAARIAQLTTLVEDRDPTAQSIGNAWSRVHYGGGFRLVGPGADRTAINLVFVQTRDGNTAGDPGAFGGGATDTHLIYEGVTRVAADAVLSGAGSLHPEAFFSVWHPELVALRLSLGFPRHPAQVIVSKRGDFEIDTLAFNVPDVPVFLIAGDACVTRHAAAVRARPWVRLVRSQGDDLRDAIHELRVRDGIWRISAIGGRFTATRLVDGGLVTDLCLTTTAREGGVPGTPWYAGAHLPPLTTIAKKAWDEEGSKVVFDHLSMA